METPINHKELLEEEWYHVRYSGEIPEIVLHSSIYYLTEDDSGPGIELDTEGLRYLQDAASQRYLEIILRDITPENRDTAMYRGLLRTISNWRRYKRFCERHGMKAEAIRDEVAHSFSSFLENEVRQVTAGIRRSCINCTIEDVSSFAVELGVSLEPLGRDLEAVCQKF